MRGQFIIYHFELFTVISSIEEFINNKFYKQETRTIFYPYDQPSHKVKTNSLGRMLKLMDKDINSKKIFTPSTSKLSKTSQKPKSNDEEKCKTEDSIRRAFSKMISQIRKGKRKVKKGNLHSSTKKKER